jgi:hypothetical protein
MSVVIKAGMKASSADEDLPDQIMRADANHVKVQLTVKEMSPKKDSPEKLRKAS